MPRTNIFPLLPPGGSGFFVSPLMPPSVRRYFLWLLPLLLLLLLLPAGETIGAMLADVLQQYGPPCLIRRVTGFSCPGCGLTRAAICLLHGEPYAALQYNYFLLPAALLVCAESLRLFICRRRGIPHGGAGERCWLGFLMVLTLCWTVLRNIYGW